METVKSVAKAGTFSLRDLNQIFAELAREDCSLMIRSDAERRSKIYTCAIAVVGNPEKSVRRDAETLSDAVVSCLRDYLANSA